MTRDDWHSHSTHPSHPSKPFTLVTQVTLFILVILVTVVICSHLRSSQYIPVIPSHC